MSEHEFDVVVFGATSVTGRRVAKYLTGRAGETELRWAAAARDLGKLDRILGEEGADAPAMIAADVGDRDSLRAMAARTRALINLVGPYTRYGEPVIEACIAEGAHYLDLTGEVPFVRRMIDRHGEAARDAGVKIVQFCGFESLPPDLGVALAAETAEERHGEPLTEVELEVAVTKTPPGLPRPTDLLSGGTLQSMAEITGDPDSARISDPAVLVADPTAAAAIRSRSPITLAPRRGGDGAVLAPMVPAAFINPAVIHRTQALLAAERGTPLAPFRYREGVAISGGPFTLPFRYVAAGSLAAIQAGMRAGTRARPALRHRLGNAMRRGLPSSGFGPAADRLTQWRWRMTVSGRTSGGAEVGVTIDAHGHPGYLATARMLGEAGMLVAEPGTTPDRAGFLTPATAIGTDAIDRFEHAQLTFAVR